MKPLNILITYDYCVGVLSSRVLRLGYWSLEEMSLKRDNATLPELTEENEDERTPSTLHKPEQDSVRFKVHIVLNPVAGRHSTADVTVSGALTPTSQEVSSDVHPTPLQGPSRVCKQSRNHRASTPSLKASGSKSPRGVRRVDVASTPVQSKSRHVISGLRKRSLTFRDQR
ncbi:hypothetical protein L798_00290 [Zootermopsis nevadensis]|uniref:Uncharacterized protein n=1 Tax=Zootermopsis nevadensis TaxID=136037 RepID=A0A067RIU0_ZOONE|nr:hypothetical protein L798_00290 [Zootermopsis nevadensis]